MSLFSDIDEFRVWSFAKTEQEIASQMRRILDPNFDTVDTQRATSKYPVVGPTLLVGASAS